MAAGPGRVLRANYPCHCQAFFVYHVGYSGDEAQSPPDDLLRSVVHGKPGIAKPFLYTVLGIAVMTLRQCPLLDNDSSLGYTAFHKT